MGSEIGLSIADYFSSLHSLSLNKNNEIFSIPLIDIKNNNFQLHIKRYEMRGFKVQITKIEKLKE